MKTQIANERRKLLKSLEKIFEGPMIVLGFLWLVLIVIELVWGGNRGLETASLVIWCIFILDFAIKFFLAPEKVKYLKLNWLTLISLLIPALRLFRVLRIFRLLRGVRLVRVVASLNRSMKSLGSAMRRRGFAYVAALVCIVTFGGAAGMYALERGNPGFENFGMALWWSSMRVITAGSDFWPATPEGRVLAFIISVFGYAVFGYVTAALATFFIGRDAEEKEAPVAGAREVEEIKQLLVKISNRLDGAQPHSQALPKGDGSR